MSEQTAPHEARQVAESFGVDAQRYDRARPAYQAELIERVLDDLPGRRVLDVGCGTGIAARQFQAAGCTVLGVEPDERMSQFARNRGLDVDVATFEAWDPAGRTFDAVIAAQSWHWVNPVAGAAKAADVLRPGGRLAIFGHVYQPPDPIAQAYADAFRRLVPDSPFAARPGTLAIDAYRKLYDGIADTIDSNGSFEGIESWRFPWQQTITRDEWLDVLPTTGGMTRLPGDVAAALLDAVGDAIDAVGGRFTMDSATLAVSARRR